MIVTTSRPGRHTPTCACRWCEVEFSTRRLDGTKPFCALCLYRHEWPEAAQGDEAEITALVARLRTQIHSEAQD